MTSEVEITRTRCANPSCEEVLLQHGDHCRHCYQTMYCDRTCKRLHVPIHKAECKEQLRMAKFESEHRLPSWAPRTLHEALLNKHRGIEDPSVSIIRTADDPNSRQDKPPYGIENRPVFDIDGNYDTDARAESLQCNIDLFGTYPAIDVLKLKRNEGASHKERLDLLFSGSTDLRDVIQTIVSLPEDFSAPLRIVISDSASIRTARNLILLLMAGCSGDSLATAECAVHFWYSAYLPEGCMDAIRDDIQKYIFWPQANEPKRPNDFKEYDVDADVATGIPRGWNFGTTKIETLLTCNIWSALKGILNPNRCAKAKGARRLQEVGEHFSNEKNPDYKDKQLLDAALEWRSGKEKYMLKRQLLPFSEHENQEYEYLDWNPSLFGYGVWPFKPDADPLRGWDISDIVRTTMILYHLVVAGGDIYGKVFYHVRTLFQQFVRKLRKLDVTFEVVPYDHIHVPKYIEGRFDRIHTEALADEDNEGVVNVVRLFSPLLKDVSINPCATLITLHADIFGKVRKAFHCTTCHPDRESRLQRAVTLTEPERRKMDIYLPLPAQNQEAGNENPIEEVDWIFTMTGWQRREARWLFRDPEDAWSLYKDIFEFEGVQNQSGVTIKENNSIVDKWASMQLQYRQMRTNRGRPGFEAQLEFDALMIKHRTSAYRYVEWQKSHPSTNRMEREESRKEGEVSKVKSGRRGKRQRPSGHDEQQTERRETSMDERERDRTILQGPGDAQPAENSSRLETWNGRQYLHYWAPH